MAIPSSETLPYEIAYFFMRLLRRLSNGKYIYSRRHRIQETIPDELDRLMKTNYQEFLADFEASTYEKAGLAGWSYGNSSGSIAHVLYSLADLLQARAFLEIGTYVGTSTLSIMNLMHRRGREDFLITTVDIENLFRPELFSPGTRQRLENYQDKLHFLLGSSSAPSTVAQVRQTLSSSPYDFFDLMFIDGSHIPTQVAADFHSYAGLLRSGGIILFDDMDQSFGYECFWDPVWPFPPIYRGLGHPIVLTWTADSTPHLGGGLEKD